MFLYELARKLNRARKERKKEAMGRFVASSRRVERFYPVKGERVCAMTFDDGPTVAPCSPDVAEGKGLTRHLADTMMQFGATATFDIVGDTGENYPDKAGEEGAFYWGGENFDHYPDFGKDEMAGAKNCPELVDYLLRGGFELANHGYRHLIFGKSAVYKKRVPFKNMDEVLHDLSRLHQLVEKDFGYTMKLSRPPHYIDGIAGGFTSYDAYELMGYNYMAASFDGGGWMPQKGSYEDDVKGMVEPLRIALESNPDSLNGQIIFQKDGCNMSRFTPVASALPLQLELLKKFGYRVCSVGELMALSPFMDLSPDDECFEAAKLLDADGVVIGYKNNTLRPDADMTFGELCMALAPREARERQIRLRMEGCKKIGDIYLSNPYAGALAWAAEGDIVGSAAKNADSEDFKRLLALAGKCAAVPDRKVFSRRQAICILGEAFGK
ncbi:MAG: polysaccharide deacetylase family protein [Oscillospiraceae bacterium]|nr:polysaccharide deacetylase family protein [Oscillospiraceae bacterium]